MMNRSLVSSFLVGSCFALALMASAETYTFTGTATKRADTVDDELISDKWSSGAVPEAGNDYVISGGKWCGVSGNTVFAGDKLTLGQPGSAGYLCLRNLNGKSFTIPKTVVASQTSIQFNGYTRATWNGDLTINALMPIYLDVDWWNPQYLIFTGAIDGAGDISLTKYVNEAKSMTFKFLGDMSDYAGTMTVGRTDRNSYSAMYDVIVLFGDTTVGGSINLSKYMGRIGCCGTGTDYLGECTIKNLTFGQEAYLLTAVDATTGSTIRVSEKLSLPADGVVKVQVMSYTRDQTTFVKQPLLIAPHGAGMVPEKFELTLPSSGSLTEAVKAACSPRLVVEENDAGEEVLYLVVNRIRPLLTSDAYNWGKALETVTKWEGHEEGDLFDPLSVYRTKSDKAGTTMWYSFTGDDAGTNDFAGAAVLVDSWGQLGLGKSFAASKVVMLSSSYLRPTRSPVSLTTSLYLVSGTINFVPGNSRVCTIDGDLHGSGTVNYNPMPSWYGGTRTGTFRFFGNNGDFHGKWAIQCGVADGTAKGTLVVTNGVALGGALADFAYDGIKIKEHSVLQFDASTEVTEPTRGIYVEDRGYISVPAAADTVRLDAQLTLAGRLDKQGEGTLALAGPCRFTSAQSETPVADANLLAVTAGWLRPASADCVNGCAISFAEGTGLRFAPLDETDADVQAYGLRNTKWVTPFDLSATDGKLIVAVDGVPADRDEAFSFAVCTVSPDVAESLDLAHSIVLPRAGQMRGRVSSRTNGDGSVTFVADYAKRGLILIFR